MATRARGWKIHRRDLRKSRTLQRLIEFLARRGPKGATGWEIAAALDSLSPSTEVAELRANGWDVSCTYEGMSANGRKVYRYRLEGEAA